ncbi:hypothetical protein DPMN_132418 [Dreissena polymorpha]|uniref:Uncharacterized protein n=1 Tax=Dreissena polymorpha TaxID=45954 RepID=A0A9D4FTT0_DREPO|nr:hypothetical protein DPMN_132418 [Dreissena polymorpha]
MLVSTEKSKIMVNSQTNASAGITRNPEKLEDMTSPKYLEQTRPRILPVPLRPNKNR